jgi:hypothetical protein
MWKLYLSGKEGVAIKTNVASLIRLFSRGRALKLGRVGYWDVDDIGRHPEIHVFEEMRHIVTECREIERIVFRKNPGYTHEQEVRALIYDDYCLQHAVFNSEQLEKLQSLRRGETPVLPPGVLVPVDISTLIHKIVVSPAFPVSPISALQRAVDIAFAPSQSVKVETSALLEKPLVSNLKHTIAIP